MADAKTCTVICEVPGGLRLMERAGLAADSKTSAATLVEGRNYNVPHAIVEGFRRTPGAGLKISRVPILNVYIITRDSE
jgi:hypothetical protein